ncbi:MAG: 50S ribosomal protein L11 methyltransferase [Actinomycetota bacterium]|nr:50S ribosomal protein L11 methyltransferase [Actinomycetota bacterium]MDA3000089.1 50S ribosomal protein L11 methyltransferase [Actinomycetota bacterium]
MRRVFVATFGESTDRSNVARGVRIDVSAGDVEIVSDVLWSLGATAVSEEWCPGDGGDVVVTLRTSFGSDDETISKVLAQHLAGVAWTYEDLDLDVADSWKQFAEPTPIGRHLWIRPAWNDSTLPTDAVVVSIDPGATFGMGDHPTTRGCLSLLADSVTDGESILDVGCGSGVLGICTLVLGAGTALGVDISPASLETSRANAERNGVSERWWVTTEPLSTVGRQYDTVLANILAPVLVELAPQLVRLTRHRMIISGLLESQVARVVEALDPFVEARRVVVEGWVSIEMRRPE